MADNGNFKKFLNLVAFIGIVAVAVALLIGLIFGESEVASAFKLVAQCIAYLVTAIYAFFYIKQERNTVLTIVYVVAVIAIVVLLII